MAPKSQEEPVAVQLEAEAWTKIHGEEAERGFLHVVEVYCKWCGASAAIVSTFKRITLDMPRRKLKFFQIEAIEDIPELAKFMATSKPTFLFYLNGELCETVEGINAPLIEKFITSLTPEGELEVEDEGDGDEEEDA